MKIYGEQGSTAEEEDAREQLVRVLKVAPPSIQALADYFTEEDYNFLTS